MATQDEARAAREAKLDELHEKLTGAVEQLVSGADWARALAFAARFRTRSFSNGLLIWTQHEAAFEAGRVSEPVPSYVAGYRQWQTLGRQVQKGQQGYMIFAPVTGRFATATPGDAGSWRRLGRGEKPKPGEVARSRMVGARPAYVWDVSATDGDPIPEPPAPRLLEGQAPAGLWDGLTAQINAAGFEVVRVPHEDMIGGANGVTDFTAGTVTVRENMSERAQSKTLSHELGHVLLHGPENQDARTHRSIAEVEAESVALMIGAAHQMDTSDYTIPYVSGWAARVDGKEPVEVVKATGERVRKTALAILNQLDTFQVGDGTPPGLDRETPTTGSAGARTSGGWSHGRADTWARCAARAVHFDGRGGTGVVMASLDAVTAVLSRIETVGSLPVAARHFAAAGVPVFPCVPGGKRPLTKRGFHEATTDLGQVSAWWRQYPDANIGLPTGAMSGVVVVDVDVHGPVNGFAAFERTSRAGLVDGWQVLVDTPSGGMHAYYPATPGRSQRSWQAARAGVDFRGDGGYVVAPPSAITPARSATHGKTSDAMAEAVLYRIRQIGSGAGTHLDADRLRDVLDPRPAAMSRIGAGEPRRADTARLAAWVAARGEGERNRGLFWAACRLAENGVPATDALEVLTCAAASAGLDEREIAATVRSAYRTAHSDPASSPRPTGTGAAGTWFSRTPARSPARARELS